MTTIGLPTQWQIRADIETREVQLIIQLPGNEALRLTVDTSTALTMAELLTDAVELINHK